MKNKINKLINDISIKYLDYLLNDYIYYTIIVLIIFNIFINILINL